MKTKYGMLTPIARLSKPAKNRNRTHLRCKCDCGSECEPLEQHVLSGRTDNCGCQTYSRMSKSHIKHGHSRGQGLRTRTYNAWASMVKRCDPENGHKHYGKRGILVCAKWRSFECFLSSMGECPDGMSIERIDNNKGYSPSNCKWIPIGNQSWNRRCTHWFVLNEERLPLNVAAKRIGVSMLFLKKWRSILGDSGAIKKAIQLTKLRKSKPDWRSIWIKEHSPRSKKL